METPINIVEAVQRMLEPYSANATKEKLIAFLEGKHEELDNFITREEVGNRLKISLPTVDKLIREGNLMATKLTEGKTGIVRIRERSCVDYMRRKKL